MSARPQVTITLGRSGQVVKKAGPTSDVSFSDYAPSGSKRPLKERLGKNVDDSHMHSSLSRSKRQRRENEDRSSDDELKDDKQFISNRRIGRDDLRHKLLKKSLPRRGNIVREAENHIDLREKLSRNAQVPLRQESRQRPESRDSHQRPESRDSHQRPEPRSSGSMRQFFPTRSADDLLHLDTLRKSYSSWTSDRERHRSPDRLMGALRGISPPRNYGDLRHASSRSVDTRPTMYPSKAGLDASRPVPFMPKPSVSVDPSKPVFCAPPPGAIVQKSSHMSEEPATVASLLHSLGLGKYAILFQAEEIDMTALKQMGDQDLKELGIPMGPRKKILLAVLPRPKRHP